MFFIRVPKAEKITFVLGVAELFCIFPSLLLDKVQ